MEIEIPEVEPLTEEALNRLVNAYAQACIDRDSAREKNYELEKEKDSIELNLGCLQVSFQCLREEVRAVIEDLEGLPYEQIGSFEKRLEGIVKKLKEAL